jgi:hypothetical protein
LTELEVTGQNFVLKKEVIRMTVIRTVIVGVILVGGLTWAVVLAQVPTTTPDQPSTVYRAPGPVGYTVTTVPGDAQLAKDYVKANKEDAKKEIRKKLTESLAKQFDQHLQHQQKELDDLEKQIASVKDVLKKRQAAKNEIVERRLEQLIREAEGLGWNAPGSPRLPYGTPMFGGHAPVPAPEKTSTAPRGAAP